VTESGGFTLNGTSGTLYLVSSTSAVPGTMNASPADGTWYMIAQQNTGNITLTANSGDMFYNCNGSPASSTLVLYGGSGGVARITAITGGWQVD